MNSIFHSFGLLRERVFKNPLLFYTLVAILIYWPVSFLVFSLQYDVLDVMLPWRFFASEVFQNQGLPLWNPYQQCGYPFYADLQYSIWYPEAFVLGTFFRYSNLTLHFLFILYVVLSGLGMYKLGRQLKISHAYSLLAGIAFMFSGLFVGHAQSMVTILGATWLPWVLAAYLKMMEEPFSIKNILSLLLVSFLMMTGGYQAVSFMLFYLLLALFVFYLIKAYRKKEFYRIREILQSHGIVIGGLIILGAGMFLSIYQVFPHLDRLGGLNLAESRQYIFHPKNLLSLIMPHTSLKDLPAQTNQSMSNIFVGTMIFAGALLALFKRLPGILYIILITGIIYLLASFGSHTPVQEFFFRFVPLMDQFKYPMFYRFFFVLALIVLAAWYFDREEAVRVRKCLGWMGLGIAGVYVCAFIYSFSEINFSEFTYWNGELKWIDRFRQSNFLESMFLQSGLQIIFYFPLLIFLFFKKLPLKKLLTGFLLIEIACAAMLNMPVTVFGPFDPMEMRDNLQRYPHGFPVSKLKPLEENTDSRFRQLNLWRNMGNYTNKVSYQGFSSFQLKGRNELDKNYPELRDEILKNPVAYLSSDLLPEKLLEEEEYEIKTKDLYVAREVFGKYKTKNAGSSNEDSLYCYRFLPGEFHFQVNSEQAQYLSLLQSAFPGWRVYVNGEETEYFEVNKLFMAVRIPAGESTVKFKFEKQGISFLFYFSMIAFILLILAVTLLYYPTHKKKILIVFVLFILLFTWKKAGSKYRQNEEGFPVEEFENSEVRKEGDLSIILFDDLSDEFLLEMRWNPGVKAFSSLDRMEVAGLIEDIEEEGHNSVSLFRKGVMENPLLLGALGYLYEGADFNEYNTENTQVVFSKGKNKNVQKWPLKKSPNWKSNLPDDTTDFYSSPSSFFMDSKSEYGSTFQIKGKEIPEGKDRIISCGGWLKWKKRKKTILVMEIKRKRYKNVYKAIDISGFAKKPGEWGFFSQAMYLPQGLEGNDEIGIYLWNPEKAVFNYDDLSVLVVSPQ